MMNKLVRLFIGLLVPVLVLAGGNVNQVLAQDKATAAPPKDELTVVVDNDRVRVTEIRYKPGAESDSRARAYRVVRALKGGTVQHIYPDGKKEIVQYKTGEVKIEPAETFITKNIGKTEVLFYSVNLK